MTKNAQIKTNADGSIDTAFYMARGRKLRSEQAHKIGKMAANVPPKVTASFVSRVLSALRLRQTQA